MELLCRNAPDSDRAPGCCRFQGLAHALSTESRAEKFTGGHQRGRQFSTVAAYPAELDLSIENAEQVIAAPALVVDRAAMSK